MTDATITTPVFNALSFILGRNEGMAIFDYACPSDFQRLWSCNRLDAKRVLIVWSQTAPDPALIPINAADCLSPIDWALCYAKTHIQSINDWPEVLILDAQPDSRFSVSSLNHFKSLNSTQIPWLRVESQVSLSSIIEWMASPSVDRTSCVAAAEQFLRTIKRNLTESTSNARYDRHSISNLVAPMLLQAQPTKDSLHRAALLQLLRSCGMLPFDDRSAGSARNPAVEANVQESTLPEVPIEDGNGLSILLVDDQAEHGWTDWIRETLPSANLKTLTGPKTLLDALEAQLAGETSSDLRFRFSLPGFAKTEEPVLLLDLRLFSSNASAELAFYRRVLAIIERLSTRTLRAWPAFDQNIPSFVQAAQAIRSGSLKLETSEHFEALTWLPRILALADLSMPIILFSSTGRRELVQPFGDYGNIITTFSKPRLSDWTGERREIASMQLEVASSLQAAIALARHWLQGRKVVQRVLDTELSPLEAARKAFKGKHHIEIYHDEAARVEDKYFRVVSLIAGFSDSKAAETYNKNFTPRFYGPNAISKYATLQDFVGDRNAESIARWERDISPHLNAKNAPALLFAVVGKDGRTPSGNPTLDLFDPNGLDNINLDLLKLLWESVLCDILPAVSDLSDAEIKTTICVYGATRQRATPLQGCILPTDAVSMALNVLKGLENKWGIKRTGLDAGVVDSTGDFITGRTAAIIGRPLLAVTKPRATPPFSFLWESLNADSFSSIVADALFARQAAPGFALVAASIRKAIGVTLVYNNRETATTSARHLHYIADVLGGLWDDTRICNSPPILRMLERSGFDAPERKAVMSTRFRLVMLLNALRLMDCKQCVGDALALFAALPVHPDDLIFLVLVERIQKGLSDMSGAEFGRLCTLLEHRPAWFSENRLQTPDRIPSV